MILHPGKLGSVAICNPGSDPWRCHHPQAEDPEKGKQCHRAGVQSFLQEISGITFQQCTDREYCPIYAKESIKRIYNAYHNLGGNNVGNGTVSHKLLAMPEEV